MKFYQYFKLLYLVCLLFAGGNTLCATTYKLQQVTSVEAGCKYVFVENGRALTKDISGGYIHNTTSYKTSGLSGSENYIWETVSATGGVYLKLDYSYYLTYSGTTIQKVDNKSYAFVWQFSFNESDYAKIYHTESLGYRFIGNNGSNQYKAYSDASLASYPHDFTVYKLVESRDVTITTAKFATYCAEVGLDFSDTGAKVYAAKVVNGQVKLTEIEGGIVPANTGVLIYKEVDANETISATVKDNSTVVVDNELVGTTAETVVPETTDGKHNYILQMDGEGKAKFRKATGGKLYANRAYLSTTLSVSAHELDIVFSDEGETTGVADVRSKKSEVRGECFNLHGQRVNASHRGIVIVGGKKVVNP